MKTTVKKKSWREKLKEVKPGYPKLVEIPENWVRTMGHGKMLVPTPLIIDHYVRSVKKGKLVTVNDIRKKAAEDYHADTTCPMTTGIFLWISAGAAEEERSNGMKRITPYWRVLKEGGKLNPKFPGGVRQQAKYLEAEGFKIERAVKDTNWTVRDYTRYIAKL